MEVISQEEVALLEDKSRHFLLWPAPYKYYVTLLSDFTVLVGVYS